MPCSSRSSKRLAYFARNRGLHRAEHGSMADPIQSSTNSSWYSIPEGASAAENAAQMSSISGKSPDISPGATAGAPGAPSSAAPAPNGTALLVARFSTPSAVPVAQPSFLKAALDCGLELGSAAITTLTVAAALPETFGTSLLAIGRVAFSAASAGRCITRDEAQQTQADVKAAQAADCAAQGAIALSTADGAAVCAVLR
jgi:hypothetical protein